MRQRCRRPTQTTVQLGAIVIQTTPLIAAEKSRYQNDSGLILYYFVNSFINIRDNNIWHFIGSRAGY